MAGHNTTDNEVGALLDLDGVTLANLLILPASSSRDLRAGSSAHAVPHCFFTYPKNEVARRCPLEANMARNSLLLLKVDGHSHNRTISTLSTMSVAPERYQCQYIQQTVDSIVDRINRDRLRTTWNLQRTFQHPSCMDRITRLFPSGVLDDSPIGRVPRLGTMYDLMANLDSLIFRKSISKHCDFAWQAYLTAGGEHITGMCVPARSSESGRVTIILDSTSRTTWKDIFDTLLHEMCHAYLMLYACDQSCGMGSDCYHMARLGTTQHGSAWQQLAKAVEDSVRQEFTVTNGRLDLRRKLAAIKEYQVSNPSMSDDCVLRHFNAAQQAQIRTFVEGID